MDTSATKYRRQIGRFRIAVALLGLVCMALIVTLVVVAVRSNTKVDAPGVKADACPSSQQTIDISPPDVLPPFHDLTSDEIMEVKSFLYGQADLNIVKAADILCNSSYIFNIELNVPNKDATLRYLDEGQKAPPREAHVVLFRGDKSDPDVEEYVVGPLPNPTYKKSYRTAPFRYRPITAPEMVAASVLMKTEVQAKVEKLLRESYGGKLVDCGNQCLDFPMFSTRSSAAVGEPNTRKIWFWLAPAVEFWSLYPLDFLILLDLTGKDPSAFKIDRIYHAGRAFESLEDLQKAYEDGSFTKTRFPYPNVMEDPFATLTRHGTLFPTDPIPGPSEFEPAGKRYSIKGRHVSYMGWDLDVRMSTISGPQLFDIRYRGDRIAYELSLQDIAAYYSAVSPSIRFATYVDSVGLIGSRARALVPGSDCPKHATYLPVTHAIEFSDEPIVYERAFCVFEHDTGKPLRRHLTSAGNHRMYGGMADIVLTVRTIATVVNYDYVFDFTFHQNGAIEVSVLSTGYILTSFRFPEEDPYGFRLRDHMTGNLHHHMFHFKADMDIDGRENRFETLKIVPKEADNSMWSPDPDAVYYQTEIERNLVANEKKAALKYNSSDPTYLIFHNNNKQRKYGVPKAYRLLNRGNSKNLFKEGTGQEPSISWARYQVAVTKYNPAETTSSSMYAIWDSEKPVVNFQGFIDDNDNITDVDQVAWVSMGVHHIPHTEDFPISPTVGLHLNFYLLPYNYFDHDPAMGSADLVRIIPDQQQGLKGGVEISRYDNAANQQCVPAKSTYDEDIQSSPTSLFDADGSGPPI